MWDLSVIGYQNLSGLRMEGRGICEKVQVSLQGARDEGRLSRCSNSDCRGRKFVCASGRKKGNYQSREVEGQGRGNRTAHAERQSRSGGDQ